MINVEKSVVSTTPDGVIVINDLGLVKAFNPAAERIFGYKSSEVLGQGIRKLVPGAFREHDGVFGKNPQIGENKMFSAGREATGWRKDGSAFPVELTINGFYSGERLIVVRDITDRRKTEDDLRLSAKVFENVTNGIIVTDAKGNILSANPAVTAITGYGEQELISKHISSLRIWANDSALRKNVVAAVLETGMWHGEIRGRRKNGEIFVVWLSAGAVRDKSDRSTHYTAIFSDITEEARLREEKKSLAEQATRVQRAAFMGTASASIAHEINQPLNAIKVIAESILYWHKKDRLLDTEKIIKNIHKISQQAERISGIIRNIRYFISAGNSGKPMLCNLNEAVEVALDLLSKQLKDSDIAVVKALLRELSPVFGNSDRLGELVLNLLANAIHALNIAGRTEKEIICLTRQEGQKVILEISDNGTGIDDNILDKIFNPFFTTKKAGEGMGVGLAVAQSIVSSYKGEIKARNNEKGGTTFVVEFPVIKTATKIPAADK